MIQKMTFDQDAIYAALFRLGEVLRALGGGARGSCEGETLTDPARYSGTLADVLQHAKDEHDEAALRMAFTLSDSLRRTGNLNAIGRVEYERLDEHRHAIEVVPAGEQN